MKITLQKGPYDWTVAGVYVQGPESKEPGKIVHRPWAYYMTLEAVRTHAPEVVAKRSDLEGAPAEILEKAERAVDDLIATGEVSL